MSALHGEYATGSVGLTHQDLADLGFDVGEIMSVVESLTECEPEFTAGCAIDIGLRKRREIDNLIE